MEKKYELVKEDSITVDGFTLFRIRALKDFFVVKAGETGGYIEHEDCLSHEGDCWVFDDAKVYNTGKVIEGGCAFGNAVVTHGSKVKGFCNVKDNAVVRNYSNIEDNAVVSGNAVVDASDVKCNAKVVGNAYVSDKSAIDGFSVIGGNARIHDAVIGGNSVIDGDSYVGKNCILRSVILVNDAKVVGENFLSDIYIGFNVETNNDVAKYTDPNHPIRMVAVSKSSNQATSWNANGTIEDIIEAQHDEEERSKMKSLLQAHKDIYGIR